MKSWVIGLVLLSFAGPGASQVLDTRYCGVENIKRTLSGAIARDAGLLRDFKALYACPSTGLRHGACAGWQMDHVIPLICGGCDSLENLQWLPVQTKTCGSSVCKDRWEQRVYCNAY